jgi:hypothetical protein
LELFEDKDRPLWMDPPEFEDLFNTNAFSKTKVGGLMMRMAKPLFNTNSVFVLDSGFQSVAGMQELWKRGVFPSCLMKKKAHYARFTDGLANESFIRQQQYLTPFCKLMTFESMPWRVIAHKDTKHVVQLMTTYGTSDLIGPVRIRYHPKPFPLVFIRFRLSVAVHIVLLHAAQERARKASRELRDLRGEHCLTKMPAGAAVFGVDRAIALFELSCRHF